jgi:hypothetical protein
MRMIEHWERWTDTQSSTWNYMKKVCEQNTDVAINSKNVSNIGAQGPEQN